MTQFDCAGMLGIIGALEDLFAHTRTHLDMLTDDTIAAISTPMGEGGIAIIRISGPSALLIADRLFVSGDGKPSSFASHTIRFGSIAHEGKNGAPQRAAKLLALLADDVGAEIAIRALLVPLVTEILGQRQHDGHGQDIVLAR